MHSDCLPSKDYTPPRASPKRVQFNSLRYKFQRVKNTGQTVYINGETFTPEEFEFMFDCLQPPKE